MKGLVHSATHKNRLVGSRCSSRFRGVRRLYSQITPSAKTTEDEVREIILSVNQQDAVADAAGLGRDLVSAWVRNLRGISNTQFERICNALGFKLKLCLAIERTSTDTPE